jgi:hypothetical protein
MAPTSADVTDGEAGSVTPEARDTANVTDVTDLPGNGEARCDWCHEPIELGVAGTTAAAAQCLC